MTVNIVTGFEKINEIMHTCISNEIKADGLLSDVETLVNTYYDEGQVEEPVVWITQHPTTADRQADISQTMTLITPFEFDCGVYNPDLDIADLESQNLTGRVILSILRNWQRIQSEILPGQRMITNITLDTYSPVGYVDVTGKSDRVPVTGVVLNVHHIINWKMCCKQINNGE